MINCTKASKPCSVDKKWQYHLIRLFKIHKKAFKTYRACMSALCKEI